MATFVLIPGAGTDPGHVPMLSRPAELAERLDELCTERAR